MLRYRVHYATKVFAARTLRNKSFCCAYTTQQKFLLRAHYTTKVFNAATLSVVVVSILVALVALIVSYPILLLTNNNMMMISVRRMFKKMAN